MTTTTDKTMDAAKDRVDAAMLQSMAAALRADLPFPFNRFDMADLLDRCAERVKPRLAAVSGDEQ